MSILGKRITRTEDQRLLTAGATYVDDLCEPELAAAAHVTFVRSPVAHARITSVDTCAARGQPGLVAVLTAHDVDDVAAPDDNPFAEPLLALETVRFAGEPVAMVVTLDRYGAHDAAELVAVDYEPLRPVIDVDDALADDTLLFPAAGSNVVGSGSAGDSGELVFGDCDIVIERTIVNQRVAPVPLETRAAAAAFGRGQLTLWVSTQNVQRSRDTVAARLGLPAAAIRVIAPDVGGGFGAKIGIDREAIAIAWAARKLGRALRWTETRTENLMAMTHGRAQRQVIKLGGSREGRLLAYRLDVVQDCGAYPRLGAALPPSTVLMAPGVYDIPGVQASFRTVVTNTAPVGAYRGAGRPEATCAIERAVDLFAAELGMDPAEVRRRNMIRADQLPFTTTTGAVYDSGRYETAMDRALRAAGYDDLRAEQAGRRRRQETLQLGIGLSAYVEITADDAAKGEYAGLLVAGDGTATVCAGSSPQGQGHATSWAMIVQEHLGISADKVTVRHGDTEMIRDAIGTFASRSLQLCGSAIQQAALQICDLARKLTAEELGTDPDRLTLDTARGLWHVPGGRERGLSWAQVARRAGPDGLTAHVHYTGRQPTFPFGAHVAVVEVDVETGRVHLTRHVAVDDAGTILNPLLAEGQRHGGIAQGIAQALMEEVVYDNDGNPLTPSLAHYGFIGSADLPSFELVSMETPTHVNPLGAKGIGEAGTIGATPAVQNAVVDALSHLNVRHVEMPATPQRVWTAIREAAGEG